MTTEADGRHIRRLLFRSYHICRTNINTRTTKLNSKKVLANLTKLRYLTLCYLTSCSAWYYSYYAVQVVCHSDPFWMTTGDSDVESESPFLFRFVIVLEPKINPKRDQPIRQGYILWLYPSWRMRVRCARSGAPRRQDAISLESSWGSFCGSLPFLPEPYR